jgi:hypothetical protein
MKVLIGSDKEPEKRLTFRLLWEPRDMWIGVYWTDTKSPRLEALLDPVYLLIYITVIPCFPLCIAWRKGS